MRTLLHVLSRRGNASGLEPAAPAPALCVLTFLPRHPFLLLIQKNSTLLTRSYALARRVPALQARAEDPAGARGPCVRQARKAQRHCSGKFSTLFHTIAAPRLNTSQPRVNTILNSDQHLMTMTDMRLYLAIIAPNSIT